MGKVSRKTKSDNELDIKAHSTVFSDPKKKEAAEVVAKKKKKKRIIMAVVIVIVFAIVLLPYGIIKIVDANKVPKPLTIQQRVDRSNIKEVDDLATLLYNAKNNDPTNISANQHIADLVGMTSYCGKYTIEVYEGESNYVMRFVFERSHSTTQDSIFYNMMLEYTIVMMALVDNIEAVEWTCPGFEGGQAISERITFENIREYLNDSPKEYGKSEKNIQFMLIEYNMSNRS